MRDDTIVLLFSGSHRSGRRLFEALLEANSTSFWNAALSSAISDLKYSGFVRPSTLFVSAAPHHAETIRNAYAKRMLKSPMGESLVSLGAMGDIRPVPQLHFVPLADAFCDAVAALNRSGRAATLATVKETIAQQCSQLMPPTLDMLQQTAFALAREGLVHRVGQHLFVAPASTKTTMECQTGESLLIAPSPPKEGRRGIFARFFQRATKASSPVKRSNRAFDDRVAVIPEVAHWDHRVSPVDTALHRTQRSPLQSHRQSRRHAKRDRHNRFETSDEDLPTSTNYGPIDPPHCIGRVRRTHSKKETFSSSTSPSVPIPHKARASTPIESSDSAYSRSPSEGSSDGADDHTYVNLRGWSDGEETRFEECTLRDAPSTALITSM